MPSASPRSDSTSVEAVLPAVLRDCAVSEFAAHRVVPASALAAATSVDVTAAQTGARARALAAQASKAQLLTGIAAAADSFLPAVANSSGDGFSNSNNSSSGSSSSFNVARSGAGNALLAGTEDDFGALNSRLNTSGAHQLLALPQEHELQQQLPQQQQQQQHKTRCLGVCPGVCVGACKARPLYALNLPLSDLQAQTRWQSRLLSQTQAQASSGDNSAVVSPSLSPSQPRTQLLLQSPVTVTGVGAGVLPLSHDASAAAAAASDAVRAYMAQYLDSKAGALSRVSSASDLGSQLQLEALLQSLSRSPDRLLAPLMHRAQAHAQAQAQQARLQGLGSRAPSFTQAQQSTAQGTTTGSAVDNKAANKNINAGAAGNSAKDVLDDALMGSIDDQGEAKDSLYWTVTKSFSSPSMRYPRVPESAEDFTSSTKNVDDRDADHDAVGVYGANPPAALSSNSAATAAGRGVGLGRRPERLVVAKVGGADSAVSSALPTATHSAMPSVAHSRMPSNVPVNDARKSFDPSNPANVRAANAKGQRAPLPAPRNGSPMHLRSQSQSVLPSQSPSRPHSRSPSRHKPHYSSMGGHGGLTYDEHGFPSFEHLPSIALPLESGGGKGRVSGQFSRSQSRSGDAKSEQDSQSQLQSQQQHKPHAPLSARGTAAATKSGKSNGKATAAAAVASSAGATAAGASAGAATAAQGSIVSERNTSVAPVAVNAATTVANSYFTFTPRGVPTDVDDEDGECPAPTSLKPTVPTPSAFGHYRSGGTSNASSTSGVKYDVNSIGVGAAHKHIDAAKLMKLSQNPFALNESRRGQTAGVLDLDATAAAAVAEAESAAADAAAVAADPSATPAAVAAAAAAAAVAAAVAEAAVADAERESGRGSASSATSAGAILAQTLGLGRGAGPGGAAAGAAAAGGDDGPESSAFGAPLSEVQVKMELARVLNAQQRAIAHKPAAASSRANSGVAGVNLSRSGFGHNNHSRGNGLDGGDDGGNAIVPREVEKDMFWNSI